MNSLVTAAPEAQGDRLINFEAEQALLGALLCENSAFELVADIVSADDFAVPVHQRLFATGLGEVLAGRTANPVTLKGKFADDPELNELGGITYLASLTAMMHGMLPPADMARQIKELSRRRVVAEALSAALEAARNENVPLSAVGDLAAGAVDDGPDEGLREGSAGSCVFAHLEGLEQDRAGVTSGSIPCLDKLLGPVRPGQIIVLAARPGMGKTATAISYALGASREGHGVLFVSLEMSGEELGARMAANRIFGAGHCTEVPFFCIHSGKMNPGQRDQAKRAAADIETLPFAVADAGSLTVGRLDRLVRRQARRFAARGQRLELVIVDYLQLLRTNAPMRSNYEAVSEISRALKEIAKTHGVAVMALAQLSREVEKRPDKRPILSDLRDSGQIEQDADGVLFLLRQEYYLAQSKPDPLSPKFLDWEQSMESEQGRIEFILAKRRNGTVGTAVGQFYGAYQAVTG